MGLVWVNLVLRPNAGSLLGTLLFGGIIAVTLLWRRIAGLWKGTVGRVFLIIFGAIFAAGLGLCVFFSVNMAVYAERPCERTDCVIVLGCQVLGETPTDMLCDRLDAALELLEENPEAMCVVSGGQGNLENISEAEAMRRYLNARGIAGERIITEDRSTTTEENIRFTEEILSEIGISDNIVIVTNEFHQYRADIFARRAGLTVGHHSAQTSPRLLLNQWVREWGALAVAMLT
ncbi:MAG: YdcF family protein [Oscillospiraceae bacterium]|nr:YdcF family protein [Oscillospiraceae bacterium]